MSAPPHSSKRRRASALGLALVTLATSALIGCPPSDLGTSCRFTGDDATTCGTCIATSCQTQVNACCDETYGCESSMSAVDDCASGKSCAKLMASLPSSPSSPSSSYSFGGKLEAIATCVSTSCSTPCLGASSGSDAGADAVVVRCSLSVASCSCQATTGTGRATATPCGPSHADDGFGTPALCCADPSWPAAGTSCSCAPSSGTCSASREIVYACR